MKFGQGSAAGISLKLPPLDRDPLASLPGRSYPEIRLGAPVWGCAGWKGTLYPAQAKPADFLKHYSRALAAIELNATFYGIPPQERLLKWVRETPEHFHFCPKLPRAISHGSDPKTQREVFNRFWEEFETLGTRWGISFLQLPETLDTRGMKVLEKLLPHKPEHRSLAIEFRHPSWFEDHTLIAEAKGLLEFYRCTPVISDTLAKRHSLHQSYVGDHAFIRFLGTEDESPDMERLRDWAARLKKLGELGIQKIYFFVHQPHEEFAAVTLARFSETLEEIKEVQLHSPVKLYSEVRTFIGRRRS